MAQSIRSSSSGPMVSSFKSGKSIFRQGDEAGTIYKVEYGCVLLSKVTRTGTRQVSGFFLPGEVFGWETKGEHRFTAEAVVASGVQALRAGQVPQTGDWRHSHLIPSLTLLRDQLIIISRPTAQARVAAFLVDMMERQKSKRRLYLPMHRLDIADYLGMSPETVSRVLSRMKEMGYVDTPSIHTIDICNLDRLLTLCYK